MPTAVQTRLREVTRDNQKLNILTFVSHERYEPNLAKTGHEFWAWRGDGIRNWNPKYAPVPENYHILDPTLNERQLPLWLDIDLIISHNSFAHLDVALAVGNQFDVPVINVWHTLPPPNFNPLLITANYHIFQQCTNVFISEYNRRAWGFPDEDGVIIHHGLDLDFWKPGSAPRQPHALSVVNDWINRDWCCGFAQWKTAIMDQGVPHRVLGSTPGLSEPAKSLEELREAYQTSQVFVNTSTVSPIPMALLEAMACGCAVVSTNTCMIPEIIKHGWNGYLVDPHDVAGLNAYTQELLQGGEHVEKMMRNARQTIEESFSLDQFVSDWKELIEATVNVRH